MRHSFGSQHCARVQSPAVGHRRREVFPCFFHGLQGDALSAKARLDSNAFDLSLQVSTCGVCSRAPPPTLVFFFLLPASYTSSSSLSFFLPSYLEHSRPPSRLATWIPPAARACVHQRRTPSSSQAPQHRHFSTKTLNLFWGACAKPGVSVLCKQAPQLRWVRCEKAPSRTACVCVRVCGCVRVCKSVCSAGEELRYAVKCVPRW